MEIPIALQFFVERDRNNAYAWGMFGGLVAIFLLYGLGVHWAPRMLRKHRSRYPRAHRYYSKMLRVWNYLNATFRLRVWYLGTFYIQTTVFIVLAVYVVWLVLMSWFGTADIDYEPRYYIVGKKLGKVAVGNMPLLLLFVTKNDVMTTLTGWPAHHLTLLHIWMGRVIYFMIVVHVILTASYWINLNFMIMIVIPPQIIGMIAFGSMSMLILLSPGFIRRLSYEFFLFNHGFLSGLMLLAGFLHNDGGKAGILLAVHALALDRIVMLARAGINHWCMKPDKYMANFEILDPTTIKIVLPMSNKDLSVHGKVLHTFGNWKPGQHVYLKVPSVGRFEWHPYTIASVSGTREMLVIMKVYKGFTKRLMKKVGDECEKLGSNTCQLKTWFHGAHGATLSPLKDFDSAIFVSGGTGASFTFPVALDLMQRLAEVNPTCRCRRIRFVWYTRSRDSLKWYEQNLKAMREVLDGLAPGMVTLEVFVTGTTDLVEETATPGDIEAVGVAESDNVTEKLERKSIVKAGNVSTSESLLSVETGRPSVYEIIEAEITEQCQMLGEGSVKDIAVLSCGPAALVNEVAFEAERQERRIRGLSVYRYMEKYIV